MKLDQALTEASNDYEIKIIKISDGEGLQAFANFYNKAGTLSWQLTPARLKKKLGSRGRLWTLNLVGTGDIVGSIGLKTIKDDEGSTLAEMGYLMLDKGNGHGSLPNVMLLFKAALKRVRSFDAVFMTTDIRNKIINKLLDRTNKITLSHKINSPFSSNKLYVWRVGKKESADEIIRNNFEEHIIKEY